METGRFFIQEMPLSVHSIRKRVEAFLCANGLRLDPMDHYLAAVDAEDRIVAGGGLSGDVVKGVAVADEVRSEGISNTLISHLLSLAAAEGHENVKVFTKPGNRAVFESLGFRELAAAPEAILLENGRGLERYCASLRALRREGRCGVVVMNANPFTLGHRYLIAQAVEQVDHLFIIPVREDVSRFPYAERLAMIRDAAAEWGGRVSVVEGSAYSISAATFPTYFLKDLSAAAETQMRLDLDLFARHIAPALGVSVRFVGSEPADPLTARYNALMRELLPEVVEIDRLMAGADGPVSASAVRQALDGGRFSRAAALTPEVTHPYLLADLAQRALRLELDTPLKPGLVCPDSPGAHRDMDAALMQKSIAAIRPFFPRMAMALSADPLRQLGIDAEAAMMEAAGGVNTHRGAIFCLGLALCARGDSAKMAALAAQICSGRKTPGARSMAFGGYRELFADWLPYYRSLDGDACRLQRTLLRIISTLDDTCVLHRVGEQRAQAVKAEAAEVLGAFCPDRLNALCERYAAENISPGGAADMLSLTIFIHSIQS